jgi:hypothetical protein
MRFGLNSSVDDDLSNELSSIAAVLIAILAPLRPARTTGGHSCALGRGVLQKRWEAGILPGSIPRASFRSQSEEFIDE